MRDPYEQLHRIQNAIIKIDEYTRKGRFTFDREEEVRLSVIHYLYTIGEAAYATPHSFRPQRTPTGSPRITWSQCRHCDRERFAQPYPATCSKRGDPAMTGTLDRVQHIHEAIIRIQKYTKRGRLKFDREEETQNSIVYYLSYLVNE